MEQETQEIMNKLQKEKDIAKFTKENEAVFLERPLIEYLEMLLQRSGMKKADIIKKAGLTPVYGYQIFDGRREPKRDKVIQLAIGFSLSMEETQKLLKKAGHNELYPKVKRDVLLIYAVNNGMDIDAVENLLYQMGETSLENI